MTFDTIGLCGFGYDFESLSHETESKFISQMVKVLKVAQKRVARTELGKLWPSSEDREYFATVKDMQAVVYEVLEARKKMSKEYVWYNETILDAIIYVIPRREREAKNDLLGLMLEARDPQTGKGLSVSPRIRLIYHSNM